MARSSFWQQLKALLWRNLTLKSRNKRNTAQEILMPVFFAALLAVINVLISPTTHPALPQFEAYPLDSFTNVANGTPSSFGSFMDTWNTADRVIAVAPDSTLVQNLMDNITALMLQENAISIGYEMFVSAADAEAAFLANTTRYIVGIIFANDMLQPPSYTLRMAGYAVPQTNTEFSSEGQCRSSNGADSYNCDVNTYLYSGFLLLQKLIDTALIQYLSNSSSVAWPSLSVQMMPKFEYTTSLQVLQILGGLYYVMAYAPFINFLMVSLVTEKEKKIKEAMRMMGLRDSVFWLSWSLIYIVIILLVTLIVVLIVWAAKFFEHSNLFLFFLCLFLYGMSMVNLAFMLSPFFTKAQSAGSLASFMTMVFSMLYLAISLTRTGDSPEGPVSSIPAWGQYLLSLLSPVALALAIDQTLFLDVSAGGLNSDTIGIGQFPVQSAIIMLLVDTILYGLLAFYLDNVVPNEYGLHREPWFCFLPSYWSPPKVQHVHENPHGSDMNHIEDDSNRDVEPIGLGLRGKEAIRISHIRKVFKTKEGNFTAVNDITLDIYDGQITAILGHNGAGKTTLFNMLSGMLYPTSGTATIYGLDVSQPSAMGEIRSMTGVCPQHNALFDELSCREHLCFYGVVKGVKDEDLEEAINSSLSEVSLMDQADTFSKQLSGGQKRKLSVAIALIGDPKVIFLDEPTAGMDPASRRHLWSMLKNKQADKAILLTTHFMDEADILADRKAFVSKGELICCGSSLYLKNKFGVGYHLTMVVNTDAAIPPILALVQTHIPAAEMERQHGKEISFVLPLTAVDNFASMFGDLEHLEGQGTKASNLGILNYGVSMTNLEEVFLKLEGGKEPDERNKQNGENLINGHSGSESHLMVAKETNHSNSASSVSIPHAVNLAAFGRPTEVSSSMTRSRFSALLEFQFKVTGRQKSPYVFRLIMPLVFCVIGGILMSIQTPPAPTDPEPLLMNDIGTTYLRTPSSSGSPSLAYIPSSSGADSDFRQEVEAQDIETETLLSYSDLNTNVPHYLGYDASGAMAELVILYNSTATHGLPASLNIISNALLKMAAPNLDTSIQIGSMPWPNTDSSNAISTFSGALFGSILILGMALGFLPASFAGLTVIDREIKARGQLRLAGITLNIYWLSTFIFHFTQFFVVAILAVCILLAFQMPGLVETGAILSLLLLYILYLPVSMVFGYILAFLFDSQETAFRVLPSVIMWIGFLPYVVVMTLDATSLPDIATIVHSVFVCIDPPYSLYGGLYYINRVYLIHAFISGPDEPIPTGDYFTWDSNIPITYVVPIIQAVVFYFLLRYVEIRKTGGDPRDVFCLGSGNKKDAGVSQENKHVLLDEDEDVEEERKKVHEYQPYTMDTEPVIVAQGLRKEFYIGKSKGYPCKKSDRQKNLKVAVHNNNFMVVPGEVFGLLGPNGAGKTTTMNMIIAEEGPTAGKVYVSGHDVRSSLSEAFQAMGYCPQHDPLWPDATPTEHLILYAQARGISPQEAPAVANYFLESLKIEEHANKPSKGLSGGTKRKLSYAISMLGLPRAVLLDEPSTGMDPKSKRFLWDTISASFADVDRGAILTTHYMEEADALCNRVGIMVNGQMECLGTTQHLKSRFGSGYSLELKVNSEADSGALQQSIQRLHEYIIETFPDAVQAECFAERVIYKVPQRNVTSLALTFSALERGREEYNIQEYSFSQSSLEQVFLEFARNQLEEGQEKDEEITAVTQRARSLIRQQSLWSAGGESSPERTQWDAARITEVTRC